MAEIRVKTLEDAKTDIMYMAAIVEQVKQAVGCISREINSLKADVGIIDISNTPSMVEAIEHGHIKPVAQKLNEFVVEQIDKNSIARQLFTKIYVNAFKDPGVHSDNENRPVMLIDKVPDTIATYVRLRGTPEAKFFTGPRVTVPFGKIQTPMITKSVFELKSYNVDIRDILRREVCDVIVDEENHRFMETVRARIETNPAEQDFVLGSGLTKINIAESMRFLPKLRKPNGTLLMNDFTGRTALDCTGENVKDYEEKVAKNELVKGTILGIPALFVSDRELIKDDVIYYFSMEDFMGKFLCLQDATLYMKHEADFLEFFSFETIAIPITDIKTFVRVEYIPI